MSGLIDFGDAVWSPRVAGLAVACAYAMLGEDEPVRAIVPVVAGYDAEWPLRPEELEVLFDLIRLRLAMSVVMAARQHADDPENDYLLVSQDGVWRTLELLAGGERRPGAFPLPRRLRLGRRAVVAPRAAVLRVGPRTAGAGASGRRCRRRRGRPGSRGGRLRSARSGRARCRLRGHRGADRACRRRVRDRPLPRGPHDLPGAAVRSRRRPAPIASHGGRRLARRRNAGVRSARRSRLRRREQPGAARLRRPRPAGARDRRGRAVLDALRPSRSRVARAHGR